jgi:hypothetical protein
VKTVWLVRWPQIAGKLSYWLSITGYKRGDRSLNERLYGLYLIVFFTGWGFMVFSLVSATIHDGFSQIAGPAAVPAVVLGAGVLGLAAWIAYNLWRFARQSPLTFSEDDQYLICLTPVSRSAVALAWLFGDWIFSIPFFWATGVILSFTVLEGYVQDMTMVEMLPYYLVAGGRATSIVLPLHFGLMALTYALGCLRLQRDRSRPRYSTAIRMGVLFLVLGLGGTIFARGLDGWIGLPWNVLLYPLILPVQAAVLGAPPWWAGLALAAAFAAGGVLLLRRAGEQVNLSRAAQETVQKDTLATAVMLGQTDVAADIQRRQRLGTDHRPSLSGARPGLRMLPWKDQLQARRYFRLQPVLHWFSVLGLAVAVLLLPNLIVQAFVLLLLADNLARLLTTRLRADLSRWWLLRALPFSSGSLLLYELALPGILATLLGWLALAAAVQLGAATAPPAALIPFLVAAVGFSGAADIARKSRTAELMTGGAAPISETGVLLAFACLGIVALALNYVGSFLALSLAFAATYYTWKYAVAQIKKIG